jgi:tRNA(Arg) A34 adenosine deaminase TadA
MPSLSPLMEEAFRQARLAAQKGEVPVGAAIADAQGNLLAAAHNLVEERQNPLAHAELLALHHALEKTGTKYLLGATLAVTLEPCAMCAQAIAHARVAHVVFAASDPKSGGTLHNAQVFAHSHHKPHITHGEGEAESRTLLQTFFQSLRG